MSIFSACLWTSVFSFLWLSSISMRLDSSIEGSLYCRFRMFIRSPKSLRREFRFNSAYSRFFAILLIINITSPPSKSPPAHSQPTPSPLPAQPCRRRPKLGSPPSGRTPAWTPEPSGLAGKSPTHLHCSALSPPFLLLSTKSSPCSPLLPTRFLAHNALSSTKSQTALCLAFHTFLVDLQL